MVAYETTHELVYKAEYEVAYKISSLNMHLRMWLTLAVERDLFFDQLSVSP